MKRLISACILTAACAATAQAGNVNLNISLGTPAVAVPVAAPVPAAPVVIDEPPEFVMPSPLGFYVAVGVPYDLFYVSGSYFVVRDGIWYRSSHYRGPWHSVPYRKLPGKMRRYQIERIRAFRDSEYRHYSGDRGRYHDRFFRPAHEAREERKELRHEEHMLRKEEKHIAHEERKEARREEHVLRKEEKQAEHEEHREHRHE